MSEWDQFPTAQTEAGSSDPWASFPTVDTKKKSSTLGDFIKSMGSGAAELGATVAGLPSDAYNAVSKAAGSDSRVGYGSADLTAKLQPYLHTPEGTAGKIGEGLGYYGGMLLGGPESIAAKIGSRIVAPAVGSAIGGAATEGTQYDDLGRLVGGGVAGGVGIARARAGALGRSAAAEDAAALEAKPLSPQGDAALKAWQDVVDESDNHRDLIKGARRFKRTDEYATLHPDVQADINDLAAGNGKARSENTNLLPLALGEAMSSTIPGAGLAWMTGRAGVDALRNRNAFRAADNIANGIRRTDAGPTPTAPIVRPGPTGPSIAPPPSPWARPAPAPAAPGTGFTMQGSPFNPMGYDPAAVARARQPAPTPTPGSPPPSLGALVPAGNRGFTMPAGLPAPFADASPVPQAALPPPLVQRLLEAQRRPALPPPASGAPIGLPGSLPIRGAGAPPPLALPHIPLEGEILPPTRAAASLPRPGLTIDQPRAVAPTRFLAEPRGPSSPFPGAAPAAPIELPAAVKARMSLDELEARAKRGFTSGRRQTDEVYAEDQRRDALARAVRRPNSVPFWKPKPVEQVAQPVQAAQPVAVAQTITKANGKVKSTPVKAPPQAPQPPAQAAALPKQTVNTIHEAQFGSAPIGTSTLGAVHKSAGAVRTNKPAPSTSMAAEDGGIPDFLRRGEAKVQTASAKPVAPAPKPQRKLEDLDAGTRASIAAAKAATKGVDVSDAVARLKALQSGFVKAPTADELTIPGFLRRSPEPAAAPTRQDHIDALVANIGNPAGLRAPQPAAPALAGLSPSGFTPVETPFAGMSAAEHAKASAAAFGKTLAEKGVIPETIKAKTATHEQNVLAARPRLEKLIDPLVSKASGADQAVLIEMREQMLARPTYDNGKHRIAARDHYVAQLTDPALKAAVKEKLDDKTLRGDRPASRDGNSSYNAGAAKAARKEKAALRASKQAPASP